MSSNEWKKLRIENTIIEIIDGDRGVNYPKQGDFSNRDYCLFLNAGNVTTSGFNFSKVQFVSKEKDNILRKGKLKRNDIVLTTRGTVGNVAYYDDSIPYDNVRINSGMVIFRIPKEQEDLDTKYFYQFLTSSLFTEQVLSHSSGSAQPQLPIQDLKKIEFTFPPYKTQRRIADILSALDKKIELNRQTNATLEAIAQSIFREWFVEFNFPSATGELIESDLGMIPQGWSVGKLGEVCELTYGKGLKSENRTDGEYPVIGSNGIVGSHSEYLVEGPGIVIGRKGTIGEVIWLHENFFPIDTTFYIKDLLSVKDLYFHYFLLKEQDFKKIGSDSAVPGLNRNQAHDNVVIIPSIEVIKQFNKKMVAIFEKVFNNKQQIIALTSLRDALLPKLMSGEIEV